MSSSASYCFRCCYRHNYPNSFWVWHQYLPRVAMHRVGRSAAPEASEGGRHEPRAGAWTRQTDSKDGKSKQEQNQRRREKSRGEKRRTPDAHLRVRSHLFSLLRYSFYLFSFFLLSRPSSLDPRPSRPARRQSDTRMSDNKSERMDSNGIEWWLLVLASCQVARYLV